MNKTNVTIVFDSIYQISGLYITGIILNASTQVSISNITVNVYGLDQTYTTTTDTNGRFYVSTNTVTPGTSYTITADVTSNDYQITTTIPSRVIDIPISTNRILITRLANANITTNALITNLASGNVSTHNKINSLISSNSTINQKLTGISYTIGQTNINSNLKVNGDLILSSGNIFDMATAVQITDSMKIENDGTITSLIVNQTDTNSANIIDFQDNGTSVFVIGKNGNITNDTINKLVLSNVNLSNKISSLETSNVNIHHLLANVQTGGDLSGLVEGNITNSTLIGRLTMSNLIVFSKLSNISNANAVIFSTLNDLKNSNTTAFSVIQDLSNANVTLSQDIGNLRDNTSNISLSGNKTSINGFVTLNNLFNTEEYGVGIGTSGTGHFLDVGSLDYNTGFARFNNGVSAQDFVNSTSPSGTSIFRFLDQNYIRMVSGTSSINTIEFNTYDVKDAMIVSQHNTDASGRYLAFHVNNANERLRINYLGNIGIGVQDPNYPLDSKGDINIRDGNICISNITVIDNNLTGNLNNLTINGNIINTEFQNVSNSIINLKNSNTTIYNTLNVLTNSNTNIYTQLNSLQSGNITTVGTLTNLTVSGTGITGILNTSSQPNITSVGTLTGLSVSGTGITGTLNTPSQTNITSVGILNGLAVSGSGIVGVLATATQPNVTSVGTLTGLTVSGTGITGTLNTVSQTNITSVGTLTGLTVSGTGITGTLNTVSQPNITSVGTLTGLTVSGTGITGTLNTVSQTNITSVGTLTGLTVSGTGITGILSTASQPNITSVGTLTRLSTSGNVGIGTNVPFAPLHVFTGNTTVATTGGIAANIGCSLAILHGSNDSSRFISALDNNMTFNSSRSISFGQGTASLNQAELVFNYFTSGNINNYIGIGLNSKNNLFITGTGNVGIGTTTNIGAPLLVQGHSQASHGFISQSYLAPTFIPNGNQGSMIAWNRSGGLGEFNLINVAPNSSFRYSNFEFGSYIISSATYTSYGAWNGVGIGIGTTSPSANLHVVGTGYISSTLTVDGVLAGNYNITCSATNPFFNCSGTWFSSSIFNSTSSNATYVVCGNSSGYLQRLVSSAKYKKDIETLEDQYSEHLWQFRPVWYRSNCSVNVHDNSTYGYYGFIAEEVAQVDPRLVTFSDNDNNGVLEPEGVAYTSFVPLIVAEMKKLRLRIANLEAENTLLKLTNSNFESRISALENQ